MHAFSIKLSAKLHKINVNMNMKMCYSRCDYE